jgi:PAS domain S-box-containing protein
MPNTPQTRRPTSASSETLLTILETLPDALFVIDDAARIIYANVSAQVMTCASPVTLVGNSFWRSAPHQVSTALYQAMRQTQQGREPTDMEYVAPVTRAWLHVHLSPTGKGLLMQFHQRRTAAPHQQMVAQGERLEIDDLDSLRGEIAMLTPEGIVLEINEVPLANAQLRREEVIGRPLAETRWWSCSPTSQEQLRAAIARANQGETVRFETVVQPREGMDRYLDAAITPRMDADHHITYLIMAGNDITARRRAEAEIHVLIDTIPQLVWTARPDGSNDSVNQRYRDYTGQSSEEIQGEGWLQSLHPEDRPRVLAEWQRAVQTGEEYETEERIHQHITGEYRWFLARGMPMRDETGQIIKWFGTRTDIEDQKQIEEALRQSQKHVNVLINSSIIGIVIVEGELIVDANDTFLRMVGYTREDLRAGRVNWMRMTPPEYHARSLQAHQELDAQQLMTPYEKEFVCIDGSRLPVLVGGTVLPYYPCQTIGFVLDNSARKELEQRKDDFISMASHELRNPLTTLKLQLSILHRQLDEQGIQASALVLAGMETQINRVTRIVDELLDVSKMQAGRLEYVQEPVDLDALLQEVVETMQHTHPSHTIVVRGSVQTTLLADRDRLGQVFTNLLSNAIKYSPDAQTIEMDLEASRERVTVRVQDHGFGIPREQRDKIFERFYRAEAPRQRGIRGLGMGLYIVSEIVKSHGGTITVDSEVGKGSAFTITFPTRKEA